ncbi:MAG: acyl-CoA/acyl-ACP dehydrogenase [Halieaceae bacterium]|nr:acyl-CoA/acyl-ACP dehydrogenase [Halieaceae bacterium]
MNFDFSEEQVLLQEQARKFLADACPADLVRSALHDDAPYNEELWKGIVEMGWTAATIPEEYGGLGLSYLELVVIAEELGRAVAPVPFSSSVYLATEALLLAGSEEQKNLWLPKLADGSAIGTFALAEGRGRYSPDGIYTGFSNGKISGEKSVVSDALAASFCITVARDSNSNEVGLYLVTLNQDQAISQQALNTLDMSRSHSSIHFDGADAQPLPAGSTDSACLIDQLLDRAAVLFAWEQIGSADATLEMARDYSLERYAFGRQIGSYQALKHKMAHMYAKNTLARSNCYYAAWALNTNAPELPVAAATARVSATQALFFSSKENIQIHGGVGFTWEYDCHLHYRRARLLAVNIGSEFTWQDKLVSATQQAA